MGKYEVDLDSSSSDNLWRAAIANELAEANRLKRIELSRSKFCEKCGVIVLENTLEDQG